MEGNVLFNDTLDTFYLAYMASDIMVKDYSDSERLTSLPPLHGLLFPISSKGSFTSNEKWLNGFTTKDRSDDPSHRERAVYHGTKNRF